MATEALVVLIVGLAGTLVGAGVTLYWLVRRVRRSLDETAAVFRRLEPRLERFQQDGAVRARELDHLAATLRDRTAKQARLRPRPGRPSRIRHS